MSPSPNRERRLISPSIVILGVLVVAAAFVGLPLAVAYGDRGCGCGVVNGFLLTYGIYAVVVLFVGGLSLLDRWWGRRS